MMSDTKNIRNFDTKRKVKKVETFSYQETEMVSIFIVNDILLRVIYEKVYFFNIRIHKHKKQNKMACTLLNFHSSPFDSIIPLLFVCFVCECFYSDV